VLLCYDEDLALWNIKLLQSSAIVSRCVISMDLALSTIHEERSPRPPRHRQRLAIVMTWQRLVNLESELTTKPLTTAPKFRKHNTKRTPPMASFVQSWFANKLVEDDREPLFTVRIPRVDGEFGVLAPKIEFWLQLGQVSVMMMMDAQVFTVQFLTNFSFLSASPYPNTHFMCLFNLYLQVYSATTKNMERLPVWLRPRHSTSLLASISVAGIFSSGKFSTQNEFLDHAHHRRV
jgi:hypothetical protein